MCKTLLFTTSYCTSNLEWEERIHKWYNYYINSQLFFNKLLIIDDGSPVVPDWSNCRVVTEKFNEEPQDTSFIFKFSNNLGRPAHLDYPGWFRSFSFAAKYAYKFNYDKVIHIESDAYILSKSLIKDFNEASQGWWSMWCNRHNFPETAIQIICKDQIKNYYMVTQHDYGIFFKNKTIETCLPFTSIKRNYRGDRYHEYTTNIPVDADFACQVDHKYVI
jgi:hypothetical protein